MAKENKFTETPKIIDGEEYTIEKTDLSSLTKNKTPRGFCRYEFKDKYGMKCSLQDSSLATESAIWLGVDDPEPKIMASKTPQGGTGWVPFDIPEDVLLSTRMHLTQEQVKALLPILTYFAETGEYISEFEK
jgi:hypothetical protein